MIAFDQFLNEHPAVLIVQQGGLLRTVSNPEHSKREFEVWEAFRVAALRELRLESHPKVAEIWDFAFMQGSDHGMRWVYHYLERIAYFLKP